MPSSPFLGPFLLLSAGSSNLFINPSPANPILLVISKPNPTPTLTMSLAKASSCSFVLYLAVKALLANSFTSLGIFDDIFNLARYLKALGAGNNPSFQASLTTFPTPG